MLWIKAFHIVAMVTWFSAIFYLPRLFVYHSDARDDISVRRFKVMERRLYYGIMWPGGVLTTLLGAWLLLLAWPYYLKAIWMHIKLAMVALVWLYHLYCGHLLKQFAKDQNSHSAKYYRIINEIPVLFLVLIVIMVVVKPL